MPMPLHWSNAGLPTDTALFVVGDVHANYPALATLLAALREEIAALPKQWRVKIIFLGDYIDRGPSAPTTIDMLLAFEAYIHVQPNASVTFLCGNHDEYFRRAMTCSGVVDEVIEGYDNPRQLIYTTSTEDGALYLNGLETWLFFAGGMTSLRDYCPTLHAPWVDDTQQMFVRTHPDFHVQSVAAMLREVATSVPPTHRDFFARCYQNRYAIVGEYLMTHAGVDPKRPLAEQGIGEGAPMLKGKALIDFLMLRNPFLWQIALPFCPYVVVHGHTPSDILGGDSLIADGQKDYRLGIDTASYAPHGSITCFARVRQEAYFMAVNNANKAYVTRYSIPLMGQEVAAKFHAQHFAHYYTMTGH